MELDVASILASYGAAAPFALALYLWLRREAGRADRWEQLYLELADKTSGEVVPMLLESQRVHRAAAELSERQAALVARLEHLPEPDGALLREAARALRQQIDRADR
jgi:hypothetical protein